MHVTKIGENYKKEKILKLEKQKLKEKKKKTSINIITGFMHDGKKRARKQ